MRALLARATVAVVVAAGPSVAAAAPRVTPPPEGVAFDYQLGGTYPPAPGVGVVTRDRTARPAPGAYGICYVNAFQTQPEDHAWWRRRHPGLILRRAGRPVEDEGWPGEWLLDISTAAKRRELAGVWSAWAAGCARKGYRAMEPDNLDSYSRSRGRLRAAHTLAAARLLVAAGHRRGLAVAQKNTAELTGPLRRMGFDFAVAEECERWGECGVYTRAYGRRMLEIEYPDTGGIPVFRRACAARGGRIAVLYRDRDLVPRGDAGHVEMRCDDLPPEG